MKNKKGVFSKFLEVSFVRKLLKQFHWFLFFLSPQVKSQNNKNLKTY